MKVNFPQDKGGASHDEDKHLRSADADALQFRFVLLTFCFAFLSREYCISTIQSITK